MVRIVFVALFFLSISQATLLEEKIETFIGGNEYKIQKNLINILFQDEKSFLHVDGSVNDMKVLNQLKTSGLLKLFYDKPQDMNLSFYTKENSLIFMRVINETLSSMGYNYFLTKRALKDSNGFTWEIIVSTEHVVDPTIFSKKLSLKGCILESVERPMQNEWNYYINTDEIKIEAIEIEANTTIKLKKPIKPYWIDIFGMKSVSFRSKLADKWHPYVVFYDSKLHIIKDYQKDEVASMLKLVVPKNAKYVKVADIYTLDNIKRGLSVYLNSNK